MISEGYHRRPNNLFTPLCPLMIKDIHLIALKNCQLSISPGAPNLKQHSFGPQKHTKEHTGALQFIEHPCSHCRDLLAWCAEIFCASLFWCNCSSVLAPDSRHYQCELQVVEELKQPQDVAALALGQRHSQGLRRPGSRS